jgi:nitrogenase molybdenum-iron protein beta chain
MLNELIYDNCTSSHDPVVGCALEGVSNIIAGIRDISIVLHSPQGCASTVALGYDNHETDFTHRKIACTRLFETDIIMGATEKLRDLILKADAAYKTKVMFVIGTCSADIIGEDIDGLCKSMQPKVNARLIPIHSGGFRGNLYAGMDIGLNTLLSFAKPHEGPKRPGTVNLIAPQASLNPTWWADLKWTESVLSAMGVETACVFPREISIEEIAKATESSANILLTHDVSTTFARDMETKFGVPTILHDLPLPIGFKNTARWLRALGKYFNRNAVAEQIIEHGESTVTSILRRRGLMIIPRYRNARVAISADASMTISLVRMLFEDLEMIPELLLVRSDSKHARKVLDVELKSLGITPHVAFGIDGFKIKQSLANHDLDVVFGSAWEKYLAEELGIKVACDLLQPTNRTFYRDSAYFGYDGMINMLEILANDWESAFRSKAICWEQYQ